MATNIEAYAQAYTAAEIAAELPRAGWFGMQSDISTSYEGWTWIDADGTTKKHALTLDSSLDSVFPIGNLDIATAKYIGLGSAKGRIVFTDAGTDTISLMAANIGVGIAAPTELVHIKNSGANSEPAILIENDAQSFSMGVDGSNSDNFTIWGGSPAANAQWLSIDPTTGNIGINDVSPSSKLDIVSVSGVVPITITGATAGAETLLRCFTSGSGNVFSVQNDASNDCFVSISDANPVEKIRLHSAGTTYFNGGNVAIGAATAAQTLTVNAGSSEGVLITGATVPTLTITDTTTPCTLTASCTDAASTIETTTAHDLTIKTFGNANQLVLDQGNGNVGIGGVANASYRLDVNGAIQFGTDSVINSGLLSHAIPLDTHTFTATGNNDVFSLSTYERGILLVTITENNDSGSKNISQDIVHFNLNAAGSGLDQDVVSAIGTRNGTYAYQYNAGSFNVNVTGMPPTGAGNPTAKFDVTMVTGLTFSP